MKNYFSGLSVIIPVYNEIEGIDFLFEEIEKCKYSDYFGKSEFIIINDGSSDNSLEKILQLRRKSKLKEKIVVISHDKNYGLSFAIRTGIHNSKHDIILYCDSDLQVPFKEMEKFLPYINDFDLISGIRKNRKDHFSKTIISKIANSIKSFLIKDGTSDSGCPFKLMKKNYALKLPLEFKGFHRFIPHLFKEMGAKVNYVTVNHYRRKFGESKFNFKNRSIQPIIDLIGIKWLMSRRIKNYKVDIIND